MMSDLCRPAMNAPLVCESSADPPLMVVRAAGHLNLATAPQLRATMLKALAEQPQAVLLDARALILTDDVHLTVLIALARHAAAWPSIPIMLCGSGPQVAAGVARLAIDRHVIMCATLDEGRRRAAERPLPARIIHTFAPFPDSTIGARRIIVDACHAWRMTHIMSSAELVVTELVSNAVRHAGTPFDLSVSRIDRNLHLAVRDYATPLARVIGPVGEAEPGGRGMLIVDALTTSWGCTPTRDGKVTWATMSARH
jgi:anti-anti-sigma regulatory factor/anti-sigma regulatory factor (Ser/Thr protein kinase)